MKPYALLITLLLCGSGVTVAQQRTRDILFPDFQKDRENLKRKETEKKQSSITTARAIRSTKEQLFTDYKPQNNIRNTKSRSRKTAGAANKQPSDISNTEAAKTNQDKQPVQSVTVPTQGNETENNNSPAVKAAPLKTPASPATAPAPKSAPAKQIIRPNKQ